MSRARILGFAALCLVCALGAGAYVRHALQRVPAPPDTATDGAAAVAAAGAPGLDGQSSPLLLFRNTSVDPSYGKLAVAPLENVADRRIVPVLSCERVDYAAGRGVCLTASRGVTTTYAAIVFDQHFQPLFTLPLGGVPSRVKVARDGSVAAVSVFVTGHSYAGADFSTLTSVIDLQHGTYVVPNFEQLKVWNGAQPFEAVDRNFWGVTFARNPDTFYATVASAGRTHLIRGTVTDRQARVLRDDVECPSLSPDNTRLAFKLRVEDQQGPVRWRLAVLDLDTLEYTPLAETRSVDDQVTWLDDEHIMYALPAADSGSAEMNTWVVGADGTGEPRLLVQQAYSAIVWPPLPAPRDDGRGG